MGSEHSGRDAHADAPRRAPDGAAVAPCWRGQATAPQVPADDRVREGERPGCPAEAADVPPPRVQKALL